MCLCNKCVGNCHHVILKKHGLRFFQWRTSNIMWKTWAPLEGQVLSVRGLQFMVASGLRIAAFAMDWMPILFVVSAIRRMNPVTTFYSAAPTLGRFGGRFSLLGFTTLGPPAASLLDWWDYLRLQLIPERRQGFDGLFGLTSSGRSATLAFSGTLNSARPCRCARSSKEEGGRRSWHTKTIFSLGVPKKNRITVAIHLTLKW